MAVFMDKERARQAFSERLVEALGELSPPVTTLAEQKRWLVKNCKVSGEGARKWLQALALPTEARWPSLSARLNVLTPWLRDGLGPKRADAGSPRGTKKKAPSGAPPYELTDDQLAQELARRADDQLNRILIRAGEIRGRRR